MHYFISLKYGDNKLPQSCLDECYIYGDISKEVEIVEHFLDQKLVVSVFNPIPELGFDILLPVGLGLDDNKCINMSNKEDHEEEGDVVTRTIGKFGRYQCYQILLSSLFGIAAAWHMMVISFHDPGADHWCARPEKYQNMTVDEWKKHAIPPDPSVGNLKYVKTL